MWVKFLSLVSFSLITQAASAALTIAEIRNSSRVEGIGTNTITVYGGTAGQFSRCGLSGGNSDVICNNCRLPEGSPPNPGDAGLLACNSQRIYPGLILRIRMSSDSVDGFPTITDASGNNPVTLLETYPVVTKGTTVEIGVLWSELCARIFASATPAQTAQTPPCEPTSQVSAQLRIGFSTVENGGTTLSGTGNDSRTVQFVLRSQAGQVSPSNDQSLVLPCTDPTSIGLCDFSVGPGDEKAILRTFEAASDDFPVSQNTTFRLARLLFSTEGFDYVHAGSSFVDLPISASSPFTISPKRIEGLENDRQYFFKVAVVDSAGNVGYYTPTAGQDPLRQSTIPSEVVGVLSENDCFIATAAYGSPMATEIQSLRQFRASVLRATAFGRSLVQWYYRLSPRMADQIAERPWARALARGVLAPIVTLSRWTLSLPSPYSAIVGSAWVALLVGATLSLFTAFAFFTVRTAHRWIRPIYANERGLHPPAQKGKNSTSWRSRLFVGMITLAPLIEVSSAFAKPPPEYPQPGAQIVDEFEGPAQPEAKASPSQTETKSRPTRSADRTVADPEKGVKSIPRPKAVSDEGDYFFGASPPEELQRQYGKPSAPKYSNTPDREAPIQTTESGDFFYKLDSSERGGSASIKFGVLTPPTIQNPDNLLTFQDIYGEGPLPSVSIDYEFALSRQIGLIGLKIESGLMVSQATGRFRRADRLADPAEEEFTFMMVPLMAHVVYRFQYSDNQFAVPFVEGGGGYFGIVEMRDDGKTPRIGGAPATSFGGGFSFLLDFLDRKAISQLDQDYGINHVWFTVQVRQLIGLKSSIDMTSRQYFGGLTLDF